MPHTPASFPAVTALVGIPNGRAPVLVTPTAALPMISHSGTALTGERERLKEVYSLVAGVKGACFTAGMASKPRSICMA